MEAEGLNTGRLRRGLSIQARVIGALMIREALGRYGHESLGFFWIIGEPMLLMGGIMVLWTVAHITHGSEVAVVPFALTGYTYITMWRHIVNRSVGALSLNLALKYHRNIKTLDILVSRWLLELCAVFTAFTVAYIPLYFIGQCPRPQDPLNIVVGYFFGAWFAFGFGMILASLSEISHTIKHIIPAAMYITMPLTGVFTMQAWMPQTTRDILSWSPLINGIEMFRSGLFGEEVPTFWDLKYLIITCSLTNVLGFALCTLAEKFTTE